MPIPDAVSPNDDYREMQRQAEQEQLAEANNVFDIQNNWIQALLACQIPDKTYNDCKACSNPRCVYAWSKLQTLWPEIGDWPPKPVKEHDKCQENTVTPLSVPAGKLDL